MSYYRRLATLIDLHGVTYDEVHTRRFLTICRVSCVGVSNSKKFCALRGSLYLIASHGIRAFTSASFSCDAKPHEQ